MACIDLPDLGLQILYLRHPSWRRSTLPVAVVTDDKPTGTIVQQNEAAYICGILPGMRVATAQALAPELHVDIVSEESLSETLALIADTLRTCSPHVESYAQEPGVFWLDASGLTSLYKTPARWAKTIQKTLEQQGYAATIVIGFSRFPTYIIARGNPFEIINLADAQAQCARVRQVPLTRLHLELTTQEDLRRLGVLDVGSFLSLPSYAVRERFGEQAAQLWHFANEDCWDPLKPDPEQPSFEQRVHFDHPESDHIRLLFLIRRALIPILSRLSENGLAVASLFIEFTLDCRMDRYRLDAFRPAQPSLDAKVLIGLVHLRLEASPPQGDVTELVVSAEPTAASHEQLSLFADKPRRDLQAGNEALARVRAEFGDDCISYPKLRDGHLPEANFVWTPCDRMRSPKPHAVQTLNLVRTTIHRPQTLPPRQRQHPREDGWLICGHEHGPVVRLFGPFILSGGWWHREICREYYFAETRLGDVYWIYYDRQRCRWYLHGGLQ